MVDDAGYGDFSCFGQKKFKTPSVDRMAKEGMKLTDFYSSSTVCAPSRCSLMTGMHTGHALVRGNKEVQPEGQSPLAGSAQTIPEVLKKAGYVSGMFGKGQMVKPFEEAAFKASKGSIIGPIVSRFGSHIINVRDKKSENGKEQVLASHILLKVEASPATLSELRRVATLFSYDAQDSGFTVAANSKMEFK